MLIVQVCCFINLLLRRLFNILSPQDIFEGADSSLNPNIRFGVVRAGEDVVDPHILQEVGELGTGETSAITAALMRQPNSVAPFHHSRKKLLHWSDCE